jgi:diguanylate cyclase (GGDEF)-like protein
MQRWAGEPWRRFCLPAHVGWLVVAGYAVAASLIAAGSVLGWNGANATRPVDEIVTVLCLVAAAACAASAARREAGRNRAAWLALTTALLGWATGEIIWAVTDVRPALDHVNHPAAAEVVGLLWPIGAMTTLVLFSHVSRQSPRRLVLDGLIVATSLFVVAWVFILSKQLREASQLATLVQVFNEIVIMTTAILILSRRRAGDRPSRSLLAAGILTVSASDITMVFHTGTGSFNFGGLVDLGRVAGMAMMALAALSRDQESPASGSLDEITSRSRLWLPYLPLLLAAAVGLGHAVGHLRHGPMVAALLILVAAVLARQFVMLFENQSLLTEVSREAFRDSLTGLANRPHFLHQLEQAVALQRQDAAPVAVMCLDLDNFKSVNDALGHPAGDELLIRVAERITTSLAETGTVARLGGDEFAVVIEGSIEGSQAAAQRVLEAFATPIVIDGVPIAVRPSIGLTAASPASKCTVDDLLRNADLAMYAAKRDGGQCVRSFVPDMPFPYALPQLTGSAVSSLPANTSGLSRASAGQMAVPQTLRQFAAAATATRAPTDSPSNAIPWPPLSIRIALGVLAVGVLAFTLWSMLNVDRAASVFFDDILYPALNLSAAALIAVRAYRAAADRLAWSVIALSMTCSALGDVVYVLWVPPGQSPSVADPLYLAFYPLAYVGLLLLIRARLKRVPMRIRLDSLVCGLAAAAVAATLAEGPIHAAAARAPGTVLVGLIYPWGDLVLFALAASMLPIVGWRNEFRWGLLVIGFILFAVADTDYLFETSTFSYRVGTLLDACWPMSSLLVATASWAPWSSATPHSRRGLGAYAVPVVCTVVALGVTIAGHRSVLAATLAALTLIAIAARYAVTFRDVSLLAESHKDAMTDELTSLPNRRSLATALTAVSGSMLPRSPMAARAATSRALLLLELYEFDEITDSVGHHFGDELVCQVANRLAKSVRREDLLARIGDNVFAVLLPEGADLLAARAQAGRLLEILADPFMLDPMTVQVDVRIAIALCPDHCDHPQELINRAQTALPHAKSAKSKIVVYDSAFEMYRDNDPKMVEELRAALLDGDELTCHYQPKINASDESVHSVEALLRWHHPSRGLLLPEEFLPAAERAGLMRRIANRAVNVALEQVGVWRERGLASTVAVNLSTTNLLDLDLVGTIEGLLRTHRLPADALIIEITESALVDSVRSRNTVASLQRLGVRISLDDYGTGWSSLERLQDVSVDELKLDKVFVGRLAQDPRSVAIVRSTVALAQSLGADFVAEGVEDDVTLRALRRYGCNITQGFVHTPPLPADDLTEWIVHNAVARPSQEAGVTD